MRFRFTFQAFVLVFLGTMTLLTILAFGLVAAAAAVGLWMVRTVQNPIRRLVAGAASSTVGDYDYRRYHGPVKKLNVLDQALESMTASAKAREAEIKDREKLYRATVDHAPLGIDHVDRDGNILWANARLAQMLGYDPAVLATMTLNQITHPEDLDTLGQLPRLLAGEIESYSLEKRYIRCDGSIIWARVYASPVRGPTDEESFVIGIIEDVTERRQFEEVLAQSEGKFRLVTESIKDVFWMSTLGIGEIVYISPAYETVWERSTQSLYLKPRSFMEALHPDDLESYLQVVDKYHQQGQAYDCEYRIIRRNGEVRWIQERGFPVPHAPGPVRLMAGVCRDITEWRRAEKALRESERKYRQIVETANEGIWIIDEGGRTSFVNQKMADMLGYTADEMMGKLLFDFMDEEGVAFARTLLEDRRPGVEEVHELRFKKRNGDDWWGLVATSPILDSRGDYSGALGMLTDINVRKQAEKALRQSEHRFRELFDHMSDGVAIYRAEANGRDFMFIDHNRAGGRISGTRKDEIIGRSVSDVFPGVEEAGLLEVFRRVWLTGQAEHHDISLYQDERISVWVENYVFKLPSGEIVAVYDNVSQRKMAEEEVKRSWDRLRGLYARLQTAQEEERARIAREIHDELGQAMTAAKIDLTMLRREFSDETSEPRRRLESALGLLDETMLKIRTLSRDLRPSILDDFGLAAAIEWQAGDFEQRTGIQCRLDLEAETPRGSPEVITAVYRVYQECLTNVVRHARATEVVVSLAAEDGRLTLTVRDNGRGITPEEIDRPQSLGLLGMQERVELLGGVFVIKGQSGEGTMVRACLPLRRTEADGD